MTHDVIIGLSWHWIPGVHDLSGQLRPRTPAESTIPSREWRSGGGVRPGQPSRFDPTVRGLGPIQFNPPKVWTPGGDCRDLRGYRKGSPNGTCGPNERMNATAQTVLCRIALRSSTLIRETNRTFRTSRSVLRTTWSRSPTQKNPGAAWKPRIKNRALLFSPFLSVADPIGRAAGWGEEVFYSSSANECNSLAVATSPCRVSVARYCSML